MTQRKECSSLCLRVREVPVGITLRVRQTISAAGRIRHTAIFQWHIIWSRTIPNSSTPLKICRTAEAAATEHREIHITRQMTAAATVTAAISARDFYVPTAAVSVWAATLLAAAEV